MACFLHATRKRVLPHADFRLRSSRFQKMLRESIQSVLDDELTYVTLATVNLHSNESHDDPKNAKPKPCYVCLGTKRIFFFEKDLSGEWGNQLYLPYKRYDARIRLR